VYSMVNDPPAVARYPQRCRRVARRARRAGTGRDRRPSAPLAATYPSPTCAPRRTSTPPARLARSFTERRRGCHPCGTGRAIGLRAAHYRGPMSSPRVPGGVVHKLPGDLRKALIANPTALDAGRTSRLWPATSSSAGSKMPSRRRPEHAASAAPRRSWKKASVGPAAGQGANTASAPAASSHQSRGG